MIRIVSCDEIGRVLAATGSYLALATLEGEVLEPLPVGATPGAEPDHRVPDVVVWGWLVPSLIILRWQL